MRIESSQIDMRSSYHYKEEVKEQQHFELWTNEPPRDRLEISDDGQDLVNGATEVEATDNEEASLFEISDEDKAKIKLLESLISAISGKSFKIKFGFVEAKKSQGIGHAYGRHKGKANGPKQEDFQGWGARFRYNRTYTETEKVSFSSSGTVKTEDGREIAFQVNLKMSRKVHESESFHLAMGDALKDPLVINYSGGSLGLTQERYEFDLELGNDVVEQIAMPTSGSGYLAIDLNKNGVIDDGSELFGPTTNDGFSELAVHDEDGNGWIDENDSVFDSLVLWEIDDNGENQLIGLKKADVGAIYLQSQTTPFKIGDSTYGMSGKLRESGIYLKESGGAGTIHEVDLKVESKIDLTI